MVDPNLSRRRVLSGTALALACPMAVAPALAVVPVGPHPDAALLALCRRAKAEADWINKGDHGLDDDGIAAACGAINEMLFEIAAAVPVTAEGLAAKAHVVRETLFEDGFDDYLDGILLGGLFGSIDAMARETAHV